MFLVDMPLSPGLADWLTASGHDAVHASRLGLFLAHDDAILQRALAEDRIVVTADLDYAQLLAMSGASGPSVILFRSGNWSEREVNTKFAAILAAMPEHAFVSALIVVEANRLRRRPLPL